jgi:lipid II:glycine glycyltransferase (peptidoglycan interpeptide bridge formation enzyme)
MTTVARANAEVSRITSDASAWDDAVRASGGHLLQSWRWGAFKAQFGWAVERVAEPHRDGFALAQVLFRQRAGVSIGYIPRGPVLPNADAGAIDDLWKRIDQAATRRRALVVITEPDHAWPNGVAERLKLVTGPEHVQPARSVKVPLLDDAGLLAQMHAKTRYNVRLALRRGVTTRAVDASNAASDEFYRLLQDTASRNAFVIHSRDYYDAFVHQFGNDATLMFADIEGRPVAGLIAAAFGDEAIYMYAASSTSERGHGAGFLLQHEAMRWARERGCRFYDMWGIPARDPETTQSESGDRIASSSGGDWRGLYEFKTRFGGQIIDYPLPVERQYHPVLAAVARRLYREMG